jgi:hypothetical protein
MSSHRFSFILRVLCTAPGRIIESFDLLLSSSLFLSLPLVIIASSFASLVLVVIPASSYHIVIEVLVTYILSLPQYNNTVIFCGWQLEIIPGYPFPVERLELFGDVR